MLTFWNSQNDSEHQGENDQNQFCIHRDFFFLLFSFKSDDNVLSVDNEILLLAKRSHNKVL